MNPRSVALLLCLSLMTAVGAHAKTILPDACGDDSIKFDVTTLKDQPAPGLPVEGKAQIIFVEKIDSSQGPVYRYGMDGNWVGANKGPSYFVLNVDPGVHHFCVSPQLGYIKKQGTQVAVFTLEAGKVYYLAAEINQQRISGMVAPSMGPDGLSGGGLVTGGTASFGFVQLPEEDGKYRVKAGKLSNWKASK